jgi:hypothetical protein
MTAALLMAMAWNWTMDFGGGDGKWEGEDVYVFFGLWLCRRKELLTRRGIYSVQILSIIFSQKNTYIFMCRSQFSHIEHRK